MAVLPSEVKVKINVEVFGELKFCPFTKYAQRVLKNKNWYPWKFERAVGGVILTGAECPLKMDGTPNFRKRNRATECKLIYPVKEKKNASRR